jgi:hypothetical protein
MHATSPTIPEAADYLADLDKAAALPGHHDDIPKDMLSVSSGGLMPLLPGNWDSDSDEIEIIMNT